MIMGALKITGTSRLSRLFIWAFPNAEYTRSTPRATICMTPLALAAFSPPHLAVLALTVLVPLTLAGIARGAKNPRVTDGIAWAVAVVLVAEKVFAFSCAVAAGGHGWKSELPMHLCDWAAFISAWALVRRGRVACDLAWFWGLSGTLQAVLTPDLAFDFPSVEFFTFFIAHCGVVAAAVFIVFGLNIRPEPRSPWRAFVACQVYLVAATVVNLLLGTNFGYLCAKPSHASLMDWLGPWPFYIAGLELLAVVMFALLYAPFWLAKKMRRTIRGN
jgi:hypothetical integral membrane protein (TIGR02206 family)